jgi:hypothetical protein
VDLANVIEMSKDVIQPDGNYLNVEFHENNNTIKKCTKIQTNPNNCPGLPIPKYY